MKKVSIKDIAARANVSTATVSLVLSNKAGNGRVSAATIARIKELAREMNYQPNYLAVGLKSGRSNTIGLLVSDISNPFFAKLAYYVQDEMEKSGYAVIIMNTDEDHLRLQKMLLLLEGRQMDGYIVVPTDKSEEILSDFISTNSRPFVLLDRYYPNLNLSSVSIDNYNMAYSSVSSLVQRKCKRIVMITYDNDLSHLSDRKKGFLAAMTDEGLSDQASIEYVNHKTLQDDVDAIICKCLKEGNVDGMFFTTNTIAIEALKSLRKHKITIGTDVQIAAFDKNDAYDLMDSFVPYVEQPLATMGKTAATLLCKQLNEKERSCEMVELNGHFVSKKPAKFVL